MKKPKAYRHGSLLCLAAAWALSACGALDREMPTPTFSSEDVLRTAEAMAEQTRQAASPTPSPTPVTPSPTPTEATATPEVTSTPSQTAATADYNANVRSGPGENYEVVDFLLQGQSGLIVGQYTNPASGIWYYLSRAQGLDGWVWSGAVMVSGPTLNIPLLTPPPTSTSAPVTKTPTVTPTADNVPSDTPAP